MSYLSDQVYGGNSEDQGVSWSDWGKAAESATEGVGASAAAAGRWLSDKLGHEDAAELFKSLQEYGNLTASQTRDEMSDVARQRLEAAVTSNEFWSHPFSSATIKAIGMAPAMAASIAPALLMPGPGTALTAAALAGGAINAGDVINNITSEIDKKSDTELRESIPKYAALRDIYGERQAREKLNDDLVGFAPAVNFVVGALANAIGPAGKAASGVRGGITSLLESTGGPIRRGIAGATEGAVGGALQGGVADISTQDALVSGGVQKEIDENRLLNAVLESGGLGGIAGGTVSAALGGGRSKAGREAKGEPRGEPKGEPADAELGRQAPTEPTTEPATPPAGPPPKAPEATPDEASVQAPHQRIGDRSTPPKPADAEPTEAAPVRSERIYEKPEEIAPTERGAGQEAPAPQQVGGITPSSNGVDPAVRVALADVGDQESVTKATPPKLAEVMRRVNEQRINNLPDSHLPEEISSQVTPASSRPEIAPETRLGTAPPDIVEAVAARMPGPVLDQAIREGRGVSEGRLRPEGETRPVQEVSPQERARLADEVSYELADHVSSKAEQMRAAEREAAAKVAQDEERAAAERARVEAGEPAPLKRRISREQKEVRAAGDREARLIWESNKPSEEEQGLGAKSLVAFRSRLERMDRAAADAGLSVPKNIHATHTNEMLMLRQGRDLLARWTKDGSPPLKWIRDYQADELQGRNGLWGAVRERRLTEGDIRSRFRSVSPERLAEPEGPSWAPERLGRRHGETIEVQEARAAEAPPKPLTLREAGDIALPAKIGKEAETEVGLERPHPRFPKKLSLPEKVNEKASEKAGEGRPSPAARTAKATPDLSEHKYVGRILGLTRLGKEGSVLTSYGEFHAAATYHAADIMRNIDVGDYSSHVRPLMNFIKSKLADTLKGMDVKVHFAGEDEMRRLFNFSDPNRTIQGLYLPGDRLILLNTSAVFNPKKFVSVFMHESAHAMTIEGINRNEPLLRAIRKLQDHVASYFPENEYGIFRQGEGDHSRAHEFIAEAFSNERFQEKLKTIELPRQLARELGLEMWRRNTVWDAVVDTVRRAFEIMGVKVPKGSALEAAISLGEQASHAALPHEAEMYSLNWLENRVADLARKRAAEREQMRRHLQEMDKLLGTDYAARQPIRAMTEEVSPERVSEAYESVAGARVRALSQDMFELSKDATGKLARFTRKFVTDSQYGEHLIATRRFNEFHPLEFFKLNDKQFVHALDLRKPGDVLQGDLIDARGKDPAAFDKLMGIWQDATMYGVDPQSELGAGRNKRLALSQEVQAKLAKGKKLEDVVHETAQAHTEAISQHGPLKARFDELLKEHPEYRGLTERTFKYYEDAQYEIALNRVKQELQNAGVEESKLDARARDILSRGNTEPEIAALETEFGKGVAEELKSAKQLLGRGGPYLPLMRYGNIAVSGVYKVKEPTNGTRVSDNTWEFKTRREAYEFARDSGLDYTLGQRHYDEAGERAAKVDSSSTRYTATLQREHFELHESQRLARDSYRELKESGLFEQLAAPAERLELTYDSPAELSYGSVRSITKRLEQSPEYLSADATARASLRKAVLDSVNALRQGQRIQHRRLPRRRVAGASDDPVRDLAAYNVAQSSFRASQEYRPQISKGLELLDKEVSTRRYEEGNDARVSARNEIYRRVQLGSFDAQTGKVARAGRTIGMLSYIDRMMRPSHLIIQHFHIPLITAPVVAARHGAIPAYSEIMGVWRKIASMQTRSFVDAWAAIRSPTAAGQDFLKFTLSQLKGDKDLGRVQRMLEELNATGRIHPATIQEMEKLVPSARRDLLGKAESVLNRMDAVFRHATNAADAMTRYASAVGSYRLEFAKLTREGKGEEQAHVGAVRYAEKILHDTQGHFSPSNAAPLWKNQWLRPFLQFKQFPQMFYHLYISSLRDAFIGATREERIQAVRQLANLVGTHTLMAGAVGGVPFDAPRVLVTAANALGLTDTDWGDVEKWERKQFVALTGSPTAAEYMMHGLGRAAGVDVVSRLGVGDLLTYGFPEGGSDEKTWSHFILTQGLGGAPYGLGRDVFKGLGMMFHAQTTQEAINGALQAFPSQALRDVNTALKGGSSPKNYTYSGGDYAARLLGFVPAGEAYAREKRQALRSEVTEFSQQRGKLIGKWADARTPGDRSTIQTAIDRWNKGKPNDARITKGDLILAKSRRVEEERRGKSIGGVRVTKRTRHIADEHKYLYGDIP